MAQVHGEVESEAALVMSNFTAGGFRSETQKDSQTTGALGIRPLLPSFLFSPFRKAMAEGPQHGWWRPYSCRARGDWGLSGKGLTAGTYHHQVNDSCFSFYDHSKVLNGN